MKKNTKKTLEEKYQIKKPIEHILLRPDTYIGDLKSNEDDMWIYDATTQKMIKKHISYVPGLYKIFDEIIVNARDRLFVDNTCDTIRVNINTTQNLIEVYNNGMGVDVEIHKDEKVYIPTMIFGRLLSGTNFDDTEKRTTGGRNGYGAKLGNIFSTLFIVETVDMTRNRKFYQEFKNNLSICGEPIITTVKPDTESFTRIVFQPDLARFGLTTMSDDIVALFNKRVIDIAATSRTKVKASFNGVKIDVSTFKKYIELYYPESDIIYEETETYRIGVIYRPDNGFEAISHVNGISTHRGGTHVEYISNDICKRLTDIILKKNKTLKIKAAQLKDNLVLFIDCILVNPSFSSQTKEELTLKSKEFSTKCELSDKFIKKIANSGIVEQIIELAKFKEKEVLKKTDGRKVSNILGIPKLEDAKYAGRARSGECKLILTEGDSAKALVMGAIGLIGNDIYGVFPLKGKPLNVRDASVDQINKNAEITNIKTIIGLKEGVDYTNTNQLRYGGGIIILTDQDVDGSHIKGLLINLFHHKWPSLLKMNNFIEIMTTPIVKVTKGKQKLSFYNLMDYDKWRQLTINEKGWHVKYFKGLGTSDKDAAQEYFSDFENKLNRFIWDETIKIEDVYKYYRDVVVTTQDDSSSPAPPTTTSLVNPCDDVLELGFSKTRIKDRKRWLQLYDKDRYNDNSKKQLSYVDFIHKELIHFSNYDNIRSIPSVCDGLKPSQRKCLFTALENNMTKDKEEKVGLFAADVTKRTSYHHGPVSLEETAIKMAQNFVGSNNINLLYPSGQFGTRLLGGEDHSSSRYIFIALEDLTTKIFRKEDNAILTYQNDDGKEIEPEWYIPIIPMILVNGTEGIGTGYSTKVLCYNPVDIINNIYNKMNGKPMNEMLPWYKNFKGTVHKHGTNVEFIGLYTVGTDKVVIDDLPVNTWTTPYKDFVESLMVGDDKNTALAESYTQDNTDTTVHFEINFNEDELQKLIMKDTVASKLKLTNKDSTGNMHLFNSKGKIWKYASPTDIIEEFYTVRIEMYTKRKAYILGDLTRQINVLRYRVLFIQHVNNSIIEIRKQEDDMLAKQLVTLKFPQLALNSAKEASYEYLTDMQLNSLELKNAARLEEQLRNREEELAKIASMSEIDMWITELKEFTDAYFKWYTAMLTKNAEYDAAEKANKASNAAKHIKTKAAAKYATKIAKAPAKKPRAKKT
ncbi:MAG: hypothetical protein Faunusvirus43_3 [Faunusvirus sp.]|jgi:DNA topoisomerase-2|uniref:DNA topoisomerase 2 n=1 Tax=Faunusvirus sp. TaxID=2487766 RepID=A0A3G4ZXU5_9VIRU|nr:MAG: hypothetical protein Faunusvirus43_3 [Faunusvirus sp.]